MNPILVRRWLGRVLAVILTVRALDTMVGLARAIRFANEFHYTASRMDDVLAGISFMALSCLALALWFFPASIFPLTDDGTESSAPPATAREWFSLGASLIGLYLAAIGLIGVTSALIVGRPLFQGGESAVTFLQSVLYGRSPLMGLIQIVVGIAILVIFGGYASLFSPVKGQFARAFLVSPEDEELDDQLEAQRKA
ncbi:MAG: hypothetical protein ACHQ50_06400 [Fimbriimonadales bacterium]